VRNDFLNTITETVGRQGLSGVPWSSRDITLAVKVQNFFDGLEKFEGKISNESLMATFYFFHATAALFRLIFQTAVHPRTAILINTITQAAGDLWHFIILFSVLYFGFLALGVAQFASEKEDFSSVSRTFETLWEMMLGSMLESGEISSSRWGHEPLIALYLIAYNLVVFMMVRVYVFVPQKSVTFLKEL